MKKRILLVFGGQSAEHEVSIRSAKNIYHALNKEKYDIQLCGISKSGTWYAFHQENVFTELTEIRDQKLPHYCEPITLLNQNGKAQIYFLKSQKSTPVDLAFPILHGTHGEDGTIQGYFKILNLAFVGCGVLSSAAGMDKDAMKKILAAAQIPSARYETLTPWHTPSYQDLVQKLGTPFFIKPANAGSSVGVHKVKSESEFKSKIADSFRFDHKVLAEEFMQGREIECSVKGLNQSPEASLPGEVVTQHEFYSYEAKYIDEKGSQTIIPAMLTEAETKLIQDLAKKTYQAMGCDGFTRVDFFLKKDGQAVINEINTIPGFTKISMYPKMWEASGVSFSNLVEQLVGYAFQKFEMDQKLQTDFSL